MAPRMEMPKKIQSTSAVPMSVAIWAKASEDRTAPHFPHAAEKPWAKPRTRVGKTSAG